MLIEERQPIESIGEHSGNNSNNRGTVKGMRRPVAGSVSLTEDDFSTPDNSGLYSNFMSTKDLSSDVEEHAPAPKKAKTSTAKEKKASNEKGLARFMTTKS